MSFDNDNQLEGGQVAVTLGEAGTQYVIHAHLTNERQQLLVVELRSNSEEQLQQFTELIEAGKIQFVAEVWDGEAPDEGEGDAVDEPIAAESDEWIELSFDLARAELEGQVVLSVSVDPPINGETHYYKSYAPQSGVKATVSLGQGVVDGALYRLYDPTNVLDAHTVTSGSPGDLTTPGGPADIYGIRVSGSSSNYNFNSQYYYLDYRPRGVN